MAHLSRRHVLGLGVGALSVPLLGPAVAADFGAEFHGLSVFGDLNQSGGLKTGCAKGQNGRGGQSAAVLIAGDGRGTHHDVVYVEIYEGYTTPGWAGGKARRTTQLRLTKQVLEDLSRYFAQLAEHVERARGLADGGCRDAGHHRAHRGGDGHRGAQRSSSAGTVTITTRRRRTPTSAGDARSRSSGDVLSSPCQSA